MRKPISPTLHGALDYGFLAAMLTVPKLLGLPRRGRAVAAAFGAAQGGLNAVTDQPLAVRHLVPFRLHGAVDLAALPAVVGLPLLTGVLRDRRARAFFLGSGAALAAVYAFTDWDAQRPGLAETGPRQTGPQQTASRQPGPLSLGSAGPDANGVTDARSTTDPATPSEGPADAAGPTTGAIGTAGAAGPDGPRRPATVDTAPSVRSTPSATGHSIDTGVESAGNTPTADDGEDSAVARERVAGLPGETALGRRDSSAGDGTTADPPEDAAEYEGGGRR